jgi:catechol 2,3-dioxygenase-like lactoylglutathione lyase family enzyme
MRSCLEKDDMSGKRATDQKTLKESYRLAYSELSRLIEEADPIGLVAAGAPTDEYGPEVAEILARLREMGELVRKLRAAGVEVAEGEPLAGYSHVYITDPFGNRIELMEQSQ